MMMLRMPVSDATMVRLPKGATKHTCATASAGNETFFSRELLQSKAADCRLEPLDMPHAETRGGARTRRLEGRSRLLVQFDCARHGQDSACHSMIADNDDDDDDDDDDDYVADDCIIVFGGGPPAHLSCAAPKQSMQPPRTRRTKPLFSITEQFVGLEFTIESELPP
jgi:hypothetical protein